MFYYFLYFRFFSLISYVVFPFLLIYTSIPHTSSEKENLVFVLFVYYYFSVSTHSYLDPDHIFFNDDDDDDNDHDGRKTRFHSAHYFCLPFFIILFWFSVLIISILFFTCESIFFYTNTNRIT